jgi:hypothetical protein
MDGHRYAQSLMRVFRVVIILLGVVSLVFAAGRLNVREANRTGLCGSVAQGPSHDDGGASTHDCNRLRHDDGVASAALVILAVTSLGVGVGLILRRRTG